MSYRLLVPALLAAAVPLLPALVSCSSSSGSGPGGGDSGCPGCASSKIQHLVLIVQENHSFDSYFGGYCTAAAGSSPTCNDGPACCEAAPATDPAGTTPLVLDDSSMGAFDPNHCAACETAEIDTGKMDAYSSAPLPKGDPCNPIDNTTCGNKRNVAYGDRNVVKPYWDLAGQGALADRYFQPLVGQSSSNDMYFARAAFVFQDNAYEPQGAYGAKCGLNAAVPEQQFTDQTIADLLIAAGVSFNVYAGGYGDMATAQKNGQCPAKAPSDCPLGFQTYPCVFDPSDIPFEYYPSTRDAVMKDISALASDLSAGTLPAVSFVKAVGYLSEHPGVGDKMSAGIGWATSIIQEIQGSPAAASTLIVLTYDESGGYFDHVTPPGNSPADGKPYGPRIPMLALGPFAKKNYVSHAVLEHSSIVKFIEWNWLGQQTGQLKTRDAIVSNLGDLLDPNATGVAVPQ